MAVVTGFPCGKGPQVLNGTPVTAIAFGNVTNITTGAASANGAIPTDANGNQYTVLLITAVGGAAWFNFCTTSGDTAVKAAANTFAVSSSQSYVVSVPPNAKFIAAIQDSAGGTLNIVGVF